MYVLQTVFLSAIPVLTVSCRDIERPPLWPYLLTLLTENDRNGAVGIVVSDLGGTGRFLTMSEGGVVRAGYRSIHSDAAAVYGNGKVYVINRKGMDNIQVLNPDRGYVTEKEYSTGTGTNPHYIAIAENNKAYISLYDKDYLLIVDPENGAQTGRISLADYSDSDGTPEMSGMVIHEDRLYVAVQRLQRDAPSGIYPPTDSSGLVEIDMDTDKIVAEHRLDSTNPFGALQKMDLWGEPQLLVALPAGLGANADTKGGIEAFDPATKTSRGEFLYSEKVAGGDILNFQIKDENTGYAAVMFPDYSMEVQKFNPSTGKKLSVLAFYSFTAGYVSGLLLAPNGILYVADSSFDTPGIVMFDTNHNDEKLNDTPVNTELRPTYLIYIPGE